MTQIEVDGRRVSVSNRDKVLFPATGFTKGDLIDYYLKAGPVILPHLEGRPLSMRRFPDGVEEGGFWSKRCPPHRPDWVQTVPVWSKRLGEEIEFCAAGDLPTLAWAANLADIELHVSLSKADRIERPTVLAFDLDPGEPAGILECCEVATELHGLFGQLGLESFAKTSGSKGLQVYVPLNTPVTYEETKPFAKAVARAFEEGSPDRVVSRMAKELRPGKVLIDWSQNDEHKTTVCVYSVRATEQPKVSTPVEWTEIEEALEGRDRSRLEFTPAEVVDRIARHGDLFEPVLELKQRLPDAESIGA